MAAVQLGLNIGALSVAFLLAADSVPYCMEVKMSEYCEYCKESINRMFFDFDGENYARVRVGETLGYPAVLGVYTSDGCITFGINYCPRCGRDLKVVGE